MRSREAWLAAMAAVLGVSDVACKKDATEATAIAHEVTTASAATSASVSAIETASATPTTATSASASAIASATEVATTAPGLSLQRHTPLACGASATLDPIGGTGNPMTQAACGARPTVRSPSANVATTMTGGAAGDDRILLRTRPRLRNCANKGLQLDPGETGKAVVTVSIAATGDVTNATLTSSSGLGAQTTACMTIAFKSSTFAAGPARSITVSIATTLEAR